MSQAAAQQPSRKKTVISLLVLLALTCIIVFIFKDHWAEITTALAQLSFWQVLAVLAVGISYPLLEGCVAWVIVRSRLPQFKLWQGLDVGWCGTFGNVVTLGAGAVPVQLYYLHKAGLPLGPGAGLIHTDPAVSPAGGVTVNLYEKALGRSADRLIASVTDDDGRPISLPTGRTVNLLIDLNEGGGLSVYTEITPWDEIYQWDIW